MKVSVIIPTYNREKYICSAIDSVLQQVYSCIEIIVIDDGSTDNTRKVLKKYSNKIKYVYIKNSGPANARNVGMRMAQGEFIAWLDSDDLYYPHKLELQLSVFNKLDDIDLVYTEFSGFNEKGSLGKKYLKHYHSAAYSKGIQYDNIFDQKYKSSELGIEHHKRHDTDIYSGNIYKKYFQNIIVFTNSILFRKKILSQVGYQDEQFGLFHDLEFVLRICKSHKVSFIDEPTYKLRYHSGQISETEKKTKNNSLTIQKQKNLLTVFTSHGLSDKIFYKENKKMVHNRLANLHKALAFPLLTSNLAQKETRHHLKCCSKYGKPCSFLYMATYFPRLLRRVLFKIYSFTQ